MRITVLGECGASGRKWKETNRKHVPFRSYLRDVIETVNLFIKMLEKFCQGTVYVQTKMRGGGKKKANKKGASAGAAKRQHNEEMSEIDKVREVGIYCLTEEEVEVEELDVRSGKERKIDITIFDRSKLKSS